jgi:small-conductance mechanosensitive channel
MKALKRDCKSNEICPKRQFNVKTVLIMMLALMSLSANFAQTRKDSMAIKEAIPPETLKLIRISPSDWLQRSENSLILIESKLMVGYDTVSSSESGKRFLKDFQLISKEIKNYSPAMRLRTMEDIQAKLLQLQKQVESWRKMSNSKNTEIAEQLYQVKAIRQDSIQYYVRQDSSLWRIYKDQFEDINGWINKVDSQCQQSLAHFVRIERLLNNWSFEVANSLSTADMAIRRVKESFFDKTHPAIWELKANSYAKPFTTVFAETVRQSMASLAFYAKNAYIRAILFRILVMVITLLPVWYFRKNKKRFEDAYENLTYKFVHKYTGASTSSFILVMAPFIFINSPHIFTEVILVTLCITTSVIFLKENPRLDKKLVYALLAIYVILKFMNLMVNVTFFGRIIVTSSIVALIPLYGLYRSISKTSLAGKWLPRLILFLTASLFLIGWGLSISGHYPLGRILLLTSMDQFFLAIILYVAIYSFIDFIAILADLYNSSDRQTTIRVDLIYNKLLNLVRLLAIFFWFWTFIANINADEFLKEHALTIFSRQISIAGYAFTPGSLLVFFLVVYLSVYISGMLDGLFYDEKRSDENEGKTSLGSIVLLLRIFILSLGFILGMIIAGIPLNNISLFVSALGVGIGFGLQNLIGNLISGLIIAFEKPVYVGDIIEVEGVRGRVTDIGLRSTKVDTYDGAEYIIPNGELVGRILKNWTLTSKNFKIDITLQVGIKNDPEKVNALIEEVFDQNQLIILSQPSPRIRLHNITANALEYELSCWVSNIAEAKNIKSELLVAIHAKLAQNEISYPQKI